MAAIGKIRSWGPILVAVIGFALFAFIAGDLAKSCDALRNEKVNQVGKVLGEKVSAQDFSELVNDYTEIIKIQQGQDNLSGDQMNQVRDMVWQTYIQNKIVEEESEKLGLTVTDKEMENMLNQGTNPLLLSTPFVNQQTGRFDANNLKLFLARYAQEKKAGNISEESRQLYKYWTFMEKSIRDQLLAQKYQNLFTHSILSNPIEAQMAINDAANESTAELAILPYSSIADDQAEPTEAEMKAKYEEVKDIFKTFVESRDIRYVDVTVEPNADDRNALRKQFDEWQAAMTEAADPNEVVRKSSSEIPYLAVPVLKTAFPGDVASRLDSIAVGQTTKVIETGNTLNIIRLVAKQQLPDSVQYRQIYVTAEDAETINTKADSIINAIKAGGDFETIAKAYGQAGQKQWITTRDYQNASSYDNDTKTLLRDLNNMSAGEIRTIKQPNVTLITQVTDRRAMVTKYTAAVVRKNYEFSNDTYRNAYNRFSSFVSATKSAETLEENAKNNGYTVRELKDITTGVHQVGNIHETRDALKWIFEAKEGEISPLYECGDNNHLLVVVLDKINKAGYRPINDQQVKDYVRTEVLKDKKAQLLMAKLEGVKTIEEAAKIEGAKVDTIKQVTFQAPVYLPTAGSEPVLSGVVAATAVGNVAAPVKGNNGVYLVKVTEQKPLEKPATDIKAQEQTLRQRALQNAGSFFNELYLNANVTDNRYLFF